MRLEARHLVDIVGQRGRAVDGDAVVVVQEDQLLELQMAGERERLMADAFHQVAVGAQHIGVVIDDILAEFARPASARPAPMPTEEATPWPSGPVVVSTPG